MKNGIHTVHLSSKHNLNKVHYSELATINMSQLQ